MRYYVVSDVHGYYSKLISKLKQRGFSITDPNNKIILCGDAFDRGLETLKMQQFILDLIADDKLIYIRGNHEDLALEFLDNASYYLQSKRFAINTHHFSNDTINSFADLTDFSLDDMVANTKEFVELARQTPYISQLIPKTIDYFETKSHIFVHGWIPCDMRGNRYTGEIYSYKNNWRESTKKEWEKARWYNGMDAWAQGVVEPNKTIVCGHFHASYGHFMCGKSKCEFGEHANFTPFIKKGIKAIDACTAYSGKINCIVVEE